MEQRYRILFSVICTAIVFVGAIRAQDAAVKRNVAILIYDHVQIIDYAGPFEVFGGLFNVFTVAPEAGPVESIYGLDVIADYTFAEHPRPDILVLPGGGKHNPALPGAWAHALPIPDDSRILDWVRTNVERSEYVLTVCNGAFILARARLLDNLDVTTTANLLDAMKELAPKASVIDDRRFVDNGKIIMSGGLSSGIDASLHVVERVFGRGTAQRKALGLEYDWDPDGSWARAALADRLMRFNFREIDGTSLLREGDRDRWENRWRVTNESSAVDILKDVETTISSQTAYLPSGVQWMIDDADHAQTQSPAFAASRWNVLDDKGGAWHGEARVARIEGTGDYILSLSVERSPH